MATSRSDFSPVLAAGAFLVPLALTPALRSIFVLPKLAVAVLCTAGAALLALRRKKSPELASRIDVPLAVFAAAAILSSWASIDPHLSWFAHEGEYLFGMGGLAALVAAFYLGTAAGGGRCRSSHDRGGAAAGGGAGNGAATLARWSAAAALLVCLGAFVQAAGIGPFSGLAEAPGRRYGSSLGSPVVLGAYLALVFPLACRLLQSKGRDRVLGGLCLAAGVPALALSGSRGAWLAAACGVAMYYALTKPGWIPRRKSSRRRAVVGAAVVVLSGALFAAAFLFRGAADAGGSDSARREMWEIAVAEFQESPVLGSGVDTYIYGFRRRASAALAKIYVGSHAQTHAHNDWFQILATMGLAGGAAYLWLHWAVFCGMREAAARENSGWSAALLAAFAAVFVSAKFNSPGLGPLWLAAVIAGLLLREPSRRLGRARRALPLGLAAAALIWSGVFAVRVLAADRQDALGLSARRQGRLRDAARHFEKAVAWDPDNSRYRYDLANNLWSAVAGEDVRRPALLRAVQVSVEGLRRRPLDADLHRLLGLAELRRAEDGAEERLAYARRAFERADRLAPNFLPTLVGFSRVALQQGDEAMHKKLQYRIRRIGG